MEVQEILDRFQKKIIEINNEAQRSLKNIKTNK